MSFPSYTAAAAAVVAVGFFGWYCHCRWISSSSYNYVTTQCRTRHIQREKAIDESCEYWSLRKIDCANAKRCERQICAQYLCLTMLCHPFLLSVVVCVYTDGKQIDTTIKRRWCTTTGGFGNREFWELTNVTTVQCTGWCFKPSSHTHIVRVFESVSPNLGQEVERARERVRQGVGRCAWWNIVCVQVHCDRTENHYIIQTTNVSLISWQ